MQKEDVKAFMDEAGDHNVYILTDETTMYNTKAEHQVIAFDYETELVHVIRTNIDVYSQSNGAPFEITTFEFSKIALLRIVVDEATAIKKVESLKTLLGKDYDRALATIKSAHMAITSSFSPATGGKYHEIDPYNQYPIVNGNTGETIYDPEASK